MYVLIILQYVLIKYNYMYVILTRIHHHTLGAKEWSRDYLFALVIVEIPNYTYEIVFCEKIMDVLFSPLFYIHVC